MRAGRVAAAVGVGLLAFAGGAAAAAWMSRDSSLTEASPETEPERREAPVVLLVPESEPVATLAWGPSVVDWARALVDARALSTREAAGAVMVGSWNSPSAGGAAHAVSDHSLAGVILMGDAVESPGQVQALTQAVHDAAGDRGWPAIVSTDQEGGTVARLRGVVPDLPGFMAAGSAADKATVAQAYGALGYDMRELGFTVNWAPVADVTVGMADPVIRARSAGTDPANVGATVVAAMDGFLASGVMPAVKHFPGHGSVTTDSHVGLPVQSSSVEQLAQRDLAPFAEAINAGAPMIMMGHIEVSAWGSGPATTTPAAYAHLRDMGFTGVAVTDALNMAAVADAYSPGRAEVAALAAGADLLLMPRDVGAAVDAIETAVASGELPRERLDEAAARVILMMRWQEQLADAAAEMPDPGDDYARAFAATSATVSGGVCGAPLVGSSVRIRGGWGYDRDRLASALAAHGVVNNGTGTTIVLLGSPDGTGTGDIVVAMDGPWGLPSSSASTYIGLYGRSDDALAGLADVLVGAATPSSQWPVGLDVPAACAAPSTDA